MLGERSEEVFIWGLHQSVSPRLRGLSAPSGGRSRRLPNGFQPGMLQDQSLAPRGIEIDDRQGLRAQVGNLRNPADSEHRMTHQLTAPELLRQSSGLAGGQAPLLVPILRGRQSGAVDGFELLR